MKKIFISILAVFCRTIFFVPILAHAEPATSESIIVAAGEDVPIDDSVPEEYHFPAKYQADAV